MITVESVSQLAQATPAHVQPDSLESDAKVQVKLERPRRWVHSVNYMCKYRYTTRYYTTLQLCLIIVKMCVTTVAHVGSKEEKLCAHVPKDILEYSAKPNMVNSMLIILEYKFCNFLLNSIEVEEIKTHIRYKSRENHISTPNTAIF